MKPNFIPFSVANTPSSMPLGSRRKPENLEEPHMDAGRPCKTPDNQQPELRNEPVDPGAVRLQCFPLFYNKKV